MARVEVKIDGNASGLTGAMAKGQSAVRGFSEAQEEARKQVEAFDAAARKNSVNQSYARNLQIASGITNKLTEDVKKLNRELSLVKNPSFSFGAGGNPNMFPKLNNDIKETTKSFRSANGVAVEFSRIIQDLPYAANNIGSVGNNVTRLAELFANVKVQAGSTSVAIRSVFSSLLSSGNLISLGISAAVTGFTMWQMYAQKANKATKELEDGTKTYIETLKGVQRASADGQNNALKDLTNLKLLYDATQNLTIPMDKRLKTAAELIKQYPKQFEGLNKEAILAGKASEAYDKLTKSITATAMAAAYANKMTENAQKQLNNYLQIIDKQNKANKLGLDIQKEIALNAKRSAGGDTGAEVSTAGAGGNVRSLRLEQKELLQQINNLGEENLAITNESKLLQQQYNGQIIQGADASGKLNTSLEKTKDHSKEIASVLADITGALMSDFDRRVFEVNNRYEDIFKTIKKIGDAGKQKDAFGLATQAKELELLRIQAERFIYSTDKDFIKSTRNISSTGIMNTPSSLPGVENAQWLSQARLKNSKSVFKDLDKEAEKLSKQLSRAVSSFGRDIIKTLSEINQRTDITFANVFSSIVGTLSSGIAEILQTSLLQSLEKTMSSKMNDNPTTAKWAGGLGIAGSLVSGTTKRTSSIGQAAGGALTGAAAGMMFGPYGAAVGALVGAVSGLLSASSARKQEKLQEQQLAEQRKQTAIMERQNALAFASSIIGQMTTNGLITNIDRNAKGELVTKISGQDLVILMQRTGGTR